MPAPDGVSEKAEELIRLMHPLALDFDLNPETEDRIERFVRGWEQANPEFPLPASVEDVLPAAKVFVKQYVLSRGVQRAVLPARTAKPKENRKARKTHLSELAQAAAEERKPRLAKMYERLEAGLGKLPARRGQPQKIDDRVGVVNGYLLFEWVRGNKKVAAYSNWPEERRSGDTNRRITFRCRSCARDAGGVKGQRPYCKKCCSDYGIDPEIPNRDDPIYSIDYEKKYGPRIANARERWVIGLMQCAHPAADPSRNWFDKTEANLGQIRREIAHAWTKKQQAEVLLADYLKTTAPLRAKLAAMSDDEFKAFVADCMQNSD